MINTQSESRPGQFVKYSATLLVLALLAYAAFLASQSWREAKGAQAGQLSTIATLEANSVDIYLGQLKIGMQSLGADLALMNTRPDLGHAFTLVNRFQKLHEELDNVMLIRADGRILLTGMTPSRPDMPTLAGQPAFRQFVDELQQGTRFAIGQPVMGNIDKRWVVSARYAVTDRSGKLLYILSATLPADMLKRYWPDSATPAISALGLVRNDGYLVGRYPQPDAASLDELYGKPAAGGMAAFLRDGKHPQQGQLDLQDSEGAGLLVLRRLQHFPLTLFVEMPASEIKAAWWRNIHAPYFLMALLLACTFAFYSLKLRRRVWTEAQRREALRRQYEQALHETGPNEIFMFDIETLQITYANDCALKDLGYTLEQLQQKNFLALQPEMAAEPFAAMIAPLRRGEQESVTYETVQTRADGSTYPVEANVEFLAEEDGSARFLAIVNDLTAIRQAEENLRRLNAPVERRAGGNKQGRPDAP